MSFPPTAETDGRTADLAAAVGCWVAASALLVGFAQAGDLGTGDIVVPGFSEPAWWWSLVVLSLQAGVLAVRRRAPRAALVVVAAAVPALVVLGAGDATDAGVLAVIVAAYSATVSGGILRAAPSLVSAAVLVGLGSAAADLVGGAPTALVWSSGLLQVLTVGLPAVVAMFVLARRGTRAAQADRLAALEREHAALVQVAVSRERMTMARELHDIAAHHLTGIAVMTGVMERQIDVAPGDAKVAVRQVREQSTAMLREMRGLVALLRAPGDEAESRSARVETLAGIPALVEAAVTTGTDAHLRVVGARGDDGTAEDGTADVGPLAQLAAYRTVQECLSNAARHAPGARCDVVVDVRDPARVVLTVRNGPSRAAAGPRVRPPGGSGGFGLVGMRERAELTDARVEYGPTDDGGWSVTLTIPVGAATVTTQDGAGQGVADSTEELPQ